MSSTLAPAQHRRILTRIAGELAVADSRVEAAIALLDGGATVPFIARYRKEATGALDDTQLRQLEQRLGYLRELESRRATIVETIAGQGKLTEPLAAAIDAAETRQQLEDLYLPYRPKRRTRGQIAQEAGLEPLAQALLCDRDRDPLVEAAAFVAPDRGVADAKAALDGARDILAERFAEDASTLGALRSLLWDEGLIASRVVDGKQAEGEKFRDYFDHREPIAAAPSHRALALFRGRQQGILSLTLELDEAREQQVPHPCVARLAAAVGLADALNAVPGAAPQPAGAAPVRAADRWLADVLRWCWRVKLSLHFETELFGRLRERAERDAITVFSANLKDLLLAPPAGQRTVMGLDPGLRTGVKVAVVAGTGKLLETATVHPHEPRRDWQGALAELAALVQRHDVELIAIGNGTASRETDRLAAELLQRLQRPQLRKLVVSEAGASVYSASEIAAKEFPDLDVSLRGAVSIARRLQDPLAELVKIDPKSIGVGQYQHDVSQHELARGLGAVVEDCVNAVGVDVNTASAALLARVSGLTPSLAERIVAWRDEHGAFADRQSLRCVPRLGDRAFEQAAGFLRIRGGTNPLDASAVHPESYEVVQRIVARIGKPESEVIGRVDALRALQAEWFVDARFGLPTVRDVLAELEKPGRDPRGEFVTASFRDGIERLQDLQPGMVLQGVVTNVANFGAFVDVGVHQDGLVHVSALADRFVRDPREVVRVGQVVRVRVLEVDAQRKRIALTMRLNDGEQRTRREAGGPVRSGAARAGTPRAGATAAGAGQTAIAAAFEKLRRA
ncbi:MAG TPA: Tex family protein [Burkholderiaceae bacterium]|nr:Tex family protein [Burkholderiaceae bacterium]